MNNIIANNDNMQVFSREFENILHYYKRKKQRQNGLRNLIEIIDEIESSRGNELQFYQQQLSELSKISDDESSITSKYINEKEKCHHLEQQLFILNSDTENLKLKWSKEKEEIILNYEKQLDDLRSENEKQKQNYTKKENALYNELQGAQAAAAMQFDEMETKSKNLLDEANQKWREANTSCNTLRSELIRTKNQMNQMNFILNSKQKECQDLQDKLNALEANFFKVHEINISDDIANILEKDSSLHKVTQFQVNTDFTLSDVDFKTSVQNQDNKFIKDTKKGTTVSTYKPLNLIRKKEITSELDDFKVKNKKETPSFKRKVQLPPLIQVSEASEGKFFQKKRKLYNINDIGNLKEIQ